jgi:hypothetical protein
VETTQELHSKSIISYNDEAHSMHEVSFFCSKTFDFPIIGTVCKLEEEEEDWREDLPILPDLPKAELDITPEEDPPVLEPKQPFLDDIVFEWLYEECNVSFITWYLQLQECLKGCVCENDNLRLGGVQVQLLDRNNPLSEPVSLLTLKPSPWPDTVNVENLHRNIDLFRCDIDNREQVCLDKLPSFLEACFGTYLYEHFFGDLSDPMMEDFPQSQTLRRILRFVCTPAPPKGKRRFETLLDSAEPREAKTIKRDVRE